MPAIDIIPFFVACGLPAPVAEHRFAAPRRWRFDHAWLPQKVALECDGAIFAKGRHTRGKGVLADHEKLNMAAVLGWRVLRCTPQTIKSKQLVEMLRAVLEGGA